MKEILNKDDLFEAMNREFPRKELEHAVKSAYNGAKMNSAQMEQMEKVLVRAGTKYKKKAGINKIAGLVAAVLVFVVVNAVIIGFNLRYKNPANMDESSIPLKTTEVESTSVSQSVENADEPQNGDVIYSRDITVSGKKYTVCVMFGSKNENGPNNSEVVTGDFAFVVLDKEGVIKSQIPLTTGVNSEHGISLELNKEKLDDCFDTGFGDLITYKYLIGEEEGKKFYYTRFYEVTDEGEIFLYEIDASVSETLHPFNNNDLITSENFRSVANQEGLWQDYRTFEGEAILVVYDFDAESRKIKAHKLFEGLAECEALIAAQDALLSRYDLLRFSSGVPVESEEILEVAITPLGNEAALGYCKVDPAIAGSEKELLDFIENSVTSLEVLGISNREELRQKLFVESVDLFGFDKSQLLTDNIPHFKMLDGSTLGYCWVYRGVPPKFGKLQVAVCVDESTMDIYYDTGSVAEMGLGRVRMVLWKDGAWRASEFEDIKLISPYNQQDSSYTAQITTEMHVGGWARQFSLGNGEGLISKCSIKLREKLMEENRLWMEDDIWTIRQSGPWPIDSEYGYKVISCDDKNAEVLYYARTYEPHVEVWHESLDYNSVNKFVVTEENLVKYDNIETQEQFFAAYPDGIISGTGMDYLTNGLGDLLIENAKKNSGDESLSKLSNPETAAGFLLNIADSVSVTSKKNQTTGNVDVTFSFAENGGEATVTMVPLKNSGIWIPQTYGK